MNKTYLLNSVQSSQLSESVTATVNTHEPNATRNQGRRTIITHVSFSESVNGEDARNTNCLAGHVLFES